MPEGIESVDQFWTLLDDGLIIELERMPNGDHQGLRLDFDDQNLFGDRIRFVIRGDEMRRHDFATDKRFTFTVYQKLNEALATVLQQPALTVANQPNVDRLNLVLRLMRDTDTSPVMPAIVAMVRNQLRQFSGDTTSRSHLTNALQHIFSKKDPPYFHFLDIVVDHLTKAAINPDQALFLICGGRSHNGVPFAVLHNIVLTALDLCPVTVKKACRFLERLLPTADDYRALMDGGRIAAVHTERDVVLQAMGMGPTQAAVIDQCRQIVANHAHEDMFMIETAIKALGRCNGKSAVSFLVEGLNNSALQRHWEEIETALQRLCSGKKLIPQASVGFDFFSLPADKQAEIETLNDDQLRIEFEYWRSCCKGLPERDEDWLGRDAESVFWENRLRCAHRAQDWPGAQQIIAVLKEDEIPGVRLAAQTGNEP